MSDVGQFIVGTAFTAAGVGALLLPIPGGRYLGAALISEGMRRYAAGISGRPSNEDVQANVGSPEATIPVGYGTFKIGLKVEERW